MRRSRTNAPGTRLDAAVRGVEIVTAIGAAIGGLEMLRIASSYRDDGLNAWPITRTRLRGLTAGGGGRVVDAAVRYPRVLGVAAVRAASAAVLIHPRAGRRTRTGALSLLVGSGALLHLRSNFGNDGSDHFAVINFGSALVDKAFPLDPRARESALAFVAAQSCLAYFASGAAKLRSPIWRSGEALSGILRTATYGDRALYRVVRDRPRLAQAASWGVMLFEVSFPLVLIAPRRIALGILLGAGTFHVANARFMGLNRFVWSFTGAYPAVAYFARGLRPDGVSGPHLLESAICALRGRRG